MTDILDLTEPHISSSTNIRWDLGKAVIVITVCREILRPNSSWLQRGQILVLAYNQLNY